MAGFTINQVVLSGNLTRDPETRNTEGGTTLCKLRLASSERYKDSNGEWQDRPGYYDITIWKGMGDWVANNIHKGDQIVIEGRLRWREWEHEGQKHQAVEITANSIIPVPRSGNSSTGSKSSGGNYSDSDIPVDTADYTESAIGGGASDDDIPFLWIPGEWDDRYHSNR